ncbi:hypothetical protein PCCS19_34450 [Paenibacillus sp. CCS19]|nr:hypothetical protein PCCS19_34450 [Paenibacillus cellulosilyticus]
MWGVIIVIVAGVIIFAIEVPSLIKKSAWAILAAFFATLLTGMILLICMFAGIEVPGPLDPLRSIYEPIGKSIRGE